MNALNKKNKIIAIHQPGYFPWLGYFHKIFFSDIFILLDHVPIGKGNYVNRTWMKTNADKKWMTLPLANRKLNSPINSLTLANDSFKRQHKGMVNYYAKSPFYKKHRDFVLELIDQLGTGQNLAEVNKYIICKFCKLLEINTKIVCSSKLNINSQKTQLMIDLTNSQQGDVYFSGKLAEIYQETEDFETHGLELIYQDWYNYMENNPYPQTQGPFVNGLSIIDTLFNIDVCGIQQLLSEYPSRLQKKVFI